MEQEQLFIESESSAVEALAQRIGGMKKLGALMYPELLGDDAHKLLLNKLNPKNRAVFSSEDSRKAKRIGAQFDCHIYKWWCDDKTGYQRSQPTEPKDSDEELVERMEAAAAVMAKCVDILDRRKSAELKAVK